MIDKVNIVAEGDSWLAGPRYGGSYRLANHIGDVLTLLGVNISNSIGTFYYE